MKIIAGLGNPGKEYEKTRHNLGFMAIEEISQKLDIPINKEKLQGKIGLGKYKTEKVLLVEPQTFMNLSGDCISQILNFYKETADNLIVIYDDIDIEVGSIRVKPSGSPGTHNGMKDITKKLGTKEFARVRIGSGKPEEGRDLADYVLSNIGKEEAKLVKKSVEDASNAVIEILDNGIEKAMNMYN